MGKLLGKLKGYKTYLTVAIAFVIGGLNAVGVIDAAMTERILVILGFLGLGFVRAGINNSK